jgi:hypothetical protein
MLMVLDMPNAMSTTTITEKLNLHGFTTRQWRIQGKNIAIESPITLVWCSIRI